MTDRRINPVLAVVVAASLIFGVVAAGVFYLNRGSSQDEFVRRSTNPAAVIPNPEPDVGAFVITGVSGPQQRVELALAIEVPADAEAMQVSTDAGFTDAEWDVPAPTAILAVDSEGYQMVFGRFRLADGSITATSVDGVVVDSFSDAATSSFSDDRHTGSWLRPISSTELVLRVEAGRLRSGALIGYDLDDLPEGDVFDEDVGPYGVIDREGQPFAFPVSGRRDVVRLVDTLDGRPLDVDRALTGDWSLSSPDDSQYGTDTSIEDVRVVSRPTGGGLDGDYATVMPVVHDFVVTIGQPLQAGSSYRLEPPGDIIAPIELNFDPRSTVSPAVRVNQVGFAANDDAKVGFVAGWFDGIGETVVDEVLAFELIDVASGETIFEAQVGDQKSDPEADSVALTGTSVVELDFSPVDRLGRYRLCVEPVGCSYDFSIEPNPWLGLVSLVSRAMFHQRSGIELGPPYTSFERPRPYHPEDGAAVRKTGLSLLDAEDDPETRFSRIVEQGRSETVEEAWGGHFDAGDWDRRIQHLWYVRNAAQLVSLYPDLFSADLNLPESGDEVPDLLDEALWSLDLYRRMQQPDGAIRGGIEASEHPPPQSASWVDDLEVFAFEPDPWSTYLYAGVAAEVASVLKNYDADRAADYLASARLAMEWAEAQPRSGEVADLIEQQRNVAAAALLVATGEERWHQLFFDTADYLDRDRPDMSCHAHGRCEAAWLYLQAESADTDADVRAELTSRFLASADTIIEAAEETPYGWTTENPGVPLIWGLGAGGAPHTSGLMRAYLLSDDVRYRNAALNSAGYTLGANPVNAVMITGLGQEPARHPFIVDVQHGGIPAWPGTPVYGSHRLNAASDDNWVVEFVLDPAGAKPSPLEVPYLWQWYDVSTVAFFNEFTVHQSHSEALWAFGLLAATAS